jgi:hypothetical protein
MRQRSTKGLIRLELWTRTVRLTLNGQSTWMVRSERRGRPSWMARRPTRPYALHRLLGLLRPHRTHGQSPGRLRGETEIHRH